MPLEFQILLLISILTLIVISEIIGREIVKKDIGYFIGGICGILIFALFCFFASRI